MKHKEFLGELRKLSAVELKERARALAEEMMKLRFRKSGGQLEQTHRLRELKKNMARVQTVLNTRAVENIAPTE
ncbi:MAG: 50S ribosomal protein L29 [Deltaproteobacteria bacterium]|nr:50S ribosomal protein L29 [Deltaproteobacteria bacterium]